MQFGGKALLHSRAPILRLLTLAIIQR
eukprot:SAG31_NODE_39654_length_286_cov_1.374332_1_plen_26_part_01